MNRKIQWSEVCFSKHILTMVIVSIISFVFVNFEIYNQSNSKKLFKLLLFNLLYFMMNICIIKTIRSDPGRVPLIWNFTECAVRKYCVLCHNFKPPRSHHCSTCGRCVLNMDHHCPWLSNCVGFYNRKSFILAVMYGWLSLLTGIFICVPRVINYGSLTEQDIYLFFPFLFMICALFVLVSIFFQFHLNLVFKNLTTIEHLERKRALFQDNSINPYDLGCYTNTEQVLGENISLWIFPTEQLNLKLNGVQWPESKPKVLSFGNGQNYQLDNQIFRGNEDRFKDPNKLEKLNILAKSTSDQWL